MLKKKSFLKNENVANRKLGNLGNVIPSFLISKFLILPYSQNRQLGFKNLGKKFSEFLAWPFILESFLMTELFTPCSKFHFRKDSC